MIETIRYAIKRGKKYYGGRKDFVRNLEGAKLYVVEKKALRIAKLHDGYVVPVAVKMEEVE